MRWDLKEVSKKSTFLCMNNNFKSVTAILKYFDVFRVIKIFTYFYESFEVKQGKVRVILSFSVYMHVRAFLFLVLTTCLLDVVLIF